MNLMRAMPLIMRNFRSRLGFLISRFRTNQLPNTTTKMAACTSTLVSTDLVELGWRELVGTVEMAEWDVRYSAHSWKLEVDKIVCKGRKRYEVKTKDKQFKSNSQVEGIVTATASSPRPKRETTSVVACPFQILVLVQDRSRLHPNIQPSSGSPHSSVAVTVAVMVVGISTGLVRTLTTVTVTVRISGGRVLARVTVMVLVSKTVFVVRNSTVTVF